MASLQKRFKIGDKVLTRHNEVGRIVKTWEHNDNSYDWWVEIPFESEGRNFTTRCPFKNSDLRKVKDG